MILRRVALSDYGLFGALIHDHLPFAVTLEPDGVTYPYMPAGVHRCTRSFYHHGGYETFEIEVPGHTRVLFHKGNTERDTRMCVLVGEEFGVLAGVPAILQSGRGFTEFMQKCSGVNEFNLTVTEATS